MIDDALYDFLQVPENLTVNNNLFQHDVVDVTRQMIQNKIDIVYPQVMDAFRNRNLNRLQTLSKTFQKLLLDLEQILRTNDKFLLGKWLESAKAMASTKLEAKNYEFNARNQITIWGPQGQIVDYATKQWAGLVKDYCLPRWQMFLDELGRTLRDGNSKFDNNACKQKIFKQIEEPFGVSNKLYATEQTGDTRSVAREIYYKWRHI